MKLLIVLHHRLELWNVPSWFVEALRRDFPAVEIVHQSDYHQAEKYLPDIEVAITWSLYPVQF